LRLELDQPGNRLDGLADFFIEMTVDPKRRCELHRTNRGPARLVARDDVRRNRWRWPVAGARAIPSWMRRGRRDRRRGWTALSGLRNAGHGRHTSDRQESHDGSHGHVGSAVAAIVVFRTINC